MGVSSCWKQQGVEEEAVCSLQEQSPEGGCHNGPIGIKIGGIVTNAALDLDQDLVKFESIEGQRRG